MKKDSLKIVQVVHAYPPAIGGIENHVYYITRELLRSGQKVTIMTTGKDGEKGNGYEVRRFWCIDVPGFSSIKIVPFQTLMLLNIDCDIFHSHGYGSLHPFQTAIAAKLKGRPFVFTVHGYPEPSSLKARMLLWLYRNLLARFFLWAADAIILVSEVTFEKMKKETDEAKMVIIPNGVDTKMFKPKKKEGGGINITYVGRLDYEKGVHVLLDACASILKKYPDAKLNIVGNDEGMKSFLERRAERLGIREKVYFSEVERERMPRIYNDADVVVLPSFYEGLSLVLLEALACETPIVATKVGANEAVLREAYGKEAGRFLCSPNDPKELRRKIRWVINNKMKLHRIIKRGREVVKKRYSWAAVANKTLMIYKKLVQKK